MKVTRAQVGHPNDLNANLVGEGDYAIAFGKATSTHAAGAALVKKSAGNWHLVKVLPASPEDSTVLENLGVPAAQAKALIADIAKSQ